MDPPPLPQRESSAGGGALSFSVAEAARRLQISRARVYQLVAAGALEDAGTEGLRITAGSLVRRLAANPPVGALLAPLSAWALLALASGDAAFRGHVAGLLSDPDRSRARTRLRQPGLRALAPRLRDRAVVRGFAVGPEALVAIAADSRLVLSGASAARALGWTLPEGALPLEAYVAEADLVDLVQQYDLERDPAGDLVLRSAPGAWPFPPHLRVVPAVLAALDLTETEAPTLAELGRTRLEELTNDLEPSWTQRPPRRQSVRPLVPTGRVGVPPGRGVRRGREDAEWDDRTEQDARQLVALLFVAATPLRQAEVREQLRVSTARLARACAVLRTDPPRGLQLEQDGERLALVTAPDCAAVVERHLGRPVPGPLSTAAMEALAIVAYEQPITRADIRQVRGVDSDAVVDTLLAHGLVAEDPRFGGRGRPGFLVTTAAFLRHLGLGSLTDLPPRSALGAV